MASRGSLKLPNIHVLIKQKSSSLPRNLACATWLVANLLYLVYSMTQSYCLLHVIKQNCFQKTFLKALFLITPLSL